MTEPTDPAGPFFSIVVCTLDRMDLLARCLESCARLAAASPAHELILVDNSNAGIARQRIEALAAGFPVPLIYAHEPGPNISAARNRGVGLSQGRYVAFLDDDMVVPSDWLLQARTALRQAEPDLLFGLVLPRLEPLSQEPSLKRWFERAFPIADGAAIPFKRNGHLVGGRTCNAFVKRSVLLADATPFDPAFGRTGGEDTDFFQRAGQRGVTAVYSRDTVVEEIIPTARQSASYLCRREYRGSQNFLRSLRKNDRHPVRSVALNMTIGLGQTLLSLAAWSLPSSDPASRLRRRIALASALGKVFWFAQREPDAYR